MFTRREVLKGCAAGASLAAMPGCLRGSIGVEDTQGAPRRIARVLREYDAQGWHWTGSEVDTESAEWLAEEVKSRGLDVKLEPFALARIEPLDAYLEIDGKRVEGIPIFDGAVTGAEGVEGTLGPTGSAVEIAWVAQPSIADQLQDLAVSAHGIQSQLTEARSPGRHRAVVTMPARGPGRLANNAPQFPESSGPVVLQIAGANREWLLEHARRGSHGRVVVSVKRTPARAFNVVARASGSDPEAAPLVVMTPRSGWWNCASERGGGLAIWLELMTALRTQAPRRDVLFFASSGHELGFLGLAGFLGRRQGLILDASIWIHLGASIGAAKSPRLLCAASEPGLQQRAADAFAASGATQPTLIPHGKPAYGEVDEIQRGGGRYLSLMGGSALFHLDSDRWPEAVSVPETSRYANAFAQLLATLAA